MRQIAWIGAYAIAVSAMLGRAHADQIKYVFQGVGSGQVNLTPFTNQPFTFTMFAHTENVVTGPFYLGVNNDSVSLQIGAANYTGFAGSSYDFPQPSFPTSAAFVFVQALVGDDWDSGQINAYNLAFATYDMKSEVGPVSIPSTAPPAPSPLYLYFQASGNVNIGIQTMSQVTFQASFVPEPTSAALVAAGAIVLFTRRRKNDRKNVAADARR